MTEQHPNVPTPRDPDMENAGIALRRAARKVREEARAKGGYVVVFRDGQVIYERPSEEDPALDGADSDPRDRP